jgi:hypothetical protein
MNARELLIDAPPSQWPASESCALLVTIIDRQRPQAVNMLKSTWGREISRKALGLPDRFVLVMRGKAGVVMFGIADEAELAQVHRDLVHGKRFLPGNLEIFVGLAAETREVMASAMREQQLRDARPEGRA